MKNRQFLLLLGVVFTTAAILLSSCKKINEPTDVGDGLIPPVDNITTFDTTISVEAYNGLFSLLTDSQRYSRADEQFLGLISNDPLFGGTDARMFFELKPTNYPFTFGNADPDSLMLDSVVLVLDYMETYGDTLVPQTINVYEIAPSSPIFKTDSNYLLRVNNFNLGTQLGSRTILPAMLPKDGPPGQR